MVFAVALSVTAPRSGEAQASRIIGSVRNSNNEPIPGARVVLTPMGTTIESRHDGTFTFPNVPPGPYTIRVFRIGYGAATGAVIIPAGTEVTRADIRLEAMPVLLDVVVASVSRREESLIEAPAAITHFDTAVVARTLGSTITGLLSRAPGIDLTQVGIMSSFVNGRGFNKAFNSRWLTIEDGRVAMFPETGLPIGEHTTITKLDIADIEAIAGPGSALYGANASGGVLSVSTRDPRKYPGVALELSGGSRGYRDAQFRYAGSTGRWGFKIAGQHQAARDWLDTVRYANATAGNPALPEAARDLNTRATRVAGSLRYYIGDDNAHIALNAGASWRDALGHSANGRYRIDGYQYRDVQLLFRSPRWFAQAYATHSNSGDAFRLSTLTYTQAANPALSPDSARSIAAFPVDGRIVAAEVQHNDLIGSHVRTGIPLIDATRITWGLQARGDRVWSYRRLYSDALTGRAIHFDRHALYAQIASPVAGFRLVGAVRYDDDNRFPSQWSPKIGALYSLSADRVLRVTFNGAYLAPSIFQSDIFVVNTSAQFASVGNADGFDIRDSSGALVGTVSQLRPETNATWEFGFKGALHSRVYADATVYHARLRDFITQVGFVADPFAASPTIAFNRRTGRRIEDSQGNPVRLFTTVNVGEGNFAGLDAAFRFAVTPRIAVSSTTGLTHVVSIKARPTDPKEATAFNTSAHRSTLNVDYAAGPLNIAVRARYVKGYAFRSGTDWGRLPSFGTLGISATYRLASSGTTLLLQADNILSCIGGESIPPATGIGPAAQATYVPGASCGPGKRHHEILNMPAIGTAVFVGVRREWR